MLPLVLTVKGVTGELRWGYLSAATLDAWTVTKCPGPWSLTARIVTSDALRIAQRPLVFVAPHQGGAWRWPILDLQVTDGALTASLGPREK
jgi:hypothetical protein